MGGVMGLLSRPEFRLRSRQRQVVVRVAEAAGAPAAAGEPVL